MVGEVVARRHRAMLGRGGGGDGCVNGENELHKNA